MGGGLPSLLFHLCLAGPIQKRQSCNNSTGLLSKDEVTGWRPQRTLWLLKMKSVKTEDKKKASHVSEK